MPGFVGYKAFQKWSPRFEPIDVSASVLLHIETSGVEQPMGSFAMM